MPYHVLMKLLFGVSVLGHGQSAFRCKSIRYLGASWQGLWHIMAIRGVSSERPKRLSQFWQAFGRNLAGHAVQSNQLQCKYTTKWCMRQINQYKKYYHMSAHVKLVKQSVKRIVFICFGFVGSSATIIPHCSMFPNTGLPLWALMSNFTPKSIH